MIAKLRSRLPSKALFAAAFIACPAYAQAGNVADSTTAPQTASEICSTIPPVDYALAKPYLELVLIPGQKVDISKIAPEDMAKMMDLQKASTERQAMDWANLCRYAGDNAKLATDEKPVRTVFLAIPSPNTGSKRTPPFFPKQCWIAASAARPPRRYCSAFIPMSWRSSRALSTSWPVQMI